MAQIILTLLVIIIVARLILKGYKAEPVLFAAGLFLMFCTSLVLWLQPTLIGMGILVGQ